jgi:hypothetical protein
MIEEIDFIAKRVGGDTVDIQTDLYIGNDDPAPSGPFDVEVKAKEMDAHLVADKKTIHVDSVDTEKIIVASVLLTVPDQYNYIMEVLLWKNGTIIKRGEGAVQLRPDKVISSGDQFITKKIETSRFVAEQSLTPATDFPYPTRTPGFSASFAIIALAITGAIALARRGRR